MRPLLLILGLAWTLLVPAWGSFDLIGQSIKDALAEYTLTDIMNNNQFAGIEFGEAEDGFPAFRFLQTADVKSPYRMLLPEKLYEFAILITYRQSSLKGGYLFSVVNPLDTVVQLGVHLSPVVKNSYNVSLVYTQTDQSIGRKLASFSVAHVADKWNSIAFQVLSDRVSFYYDCELRNSTQVTREPIELVFDSASTLYIGQAGSIVGGKFELSAAAESSTSPLFRCCRCRCVVAQVAVAGCKSFVAQFWGTVSDVKPEQVIKNLTLPQSKSVFKLLHRLASPYFATGCSMKLVRMEINQLHNGKAKCM